MICGAATQGQCISYNASLDTLSGLCLDGSHGNYPLWSEGFTLPLGKGGPLLIARPHCCDAEGRIKRSKRSKVINITSICNVTGLLLSIGCWMLLAVVTYLHPSAPQSELFAPAARNWLIRSHVILCDHH